MDTDDHAVTEAETRARVLKAIVDDPHKADDSGWTPLMDAALFGLVDIATDLIINKHVDVNVHNGAALGYATKFPQIATMLVEHGAKLNVCNHGTTPLYQAISISKYQPECLHLAKYFLDHGADPNLYDRNECRLLPLEIAIATENAKAVELLLKYGANPNNPVMNNGSLKIIPMIEHLETHRNRSIFQLMLAHGAFVEKCTMTNIINRYKRLENSIRAEYSKHTGYVDFRLRLGYIIDLLIEYGADSNDVPDHLPFDADDIAFTETETFS